MTDRPDQEVMASLERMGLLCGTHPTCERLTGGISSDIWRIDLPEGSICIKRALRKLRVAADWQAPVERNLYEARWMQVVGRLAPGSTPALLGQDENAGLLAMAFLPASQFPLWKTRLKDGHVDPEFAGAVGHVLGRIHSGTAHEPELAAKFPTDSIFRDIRLEPYLAHTGRMHPDLSGRLGSLVDTTLANKHALVHGDVSPKNILCGPAGPVFLDAECAWWGDPAFDLAFCLNHLLLKCIWVPQARASLQACFVAMTANYLPEVDWEAPAILEMRAAHLLPALLLARVDGKSPVEYIKTGPDRNKVRRFARQLLHAPVHRLADIVMLWHEELAR